MYDRLLKSMGGGDAEHAASHIAMEHMSKAAAVLLIFWFANLFSIWAALASIPASILLLGGKNLSNRVTKENDDRLDTLLFYMTVTFAAILAFVGWNL